VLGGYGMHRVAMADFAIMDLFTVNDGAGAARIGGIAPFSLHFFSPDLIVACDHVTWLQDSSAVNSSSRDIWCAHNMARLRQSGGSVVYRVTYPCPAEAAADDRSSARIGH
jgi:hypothetical protein